MAAAVLVLPPARLTFDMLAIAREGPDTIADHLDVGVAMVQRFRFDLSEGTKGQCWIATSDALAIPAFGSAAVARALTRCAERIGGEALAEQLGRPPGRRLRREDFE